MWDDQIDHITIAKHHINILQPNTVPLHSAPYHAGPETREFKKAEIENMLVKNVN